MVLQIKHEREILAVGRMDKINHASYSRRAINIVSNHANLKYCQGLGDYPAESHSKNRTLAKKK